MERLDKVLSNLGYTTRRQTHKFLKEVEVTLDGVRLYEPSMKVDASRLIIENEPLDHPGGIFILMYKPAGYVCSHDPSEGRLIYELLPEQWMFRNPVPSTIGRLDKDTTGVILITDISRLNHELSSPKRKIDKTYQVTVDKPLTDNLVAEFGSGTLILPEEEKPCLPAKLNILDPMHAEVVLHEGRYHQVKRMFSAFGYEVVKLHRSRFGEYVLGDLKEGEYTDLPISHNT